MGAGDVLWNLIWRRACKTYQALRLLDSKGYEGELGLRSENAYASLGDEVNKYRYYIVGIWWLVVSF